MRKRNKNRNGKIIYKTSATAIAKAEPATAHGVP